ncbi:Uncharacterised protein [Moraxella lacunata]|uniref:Uncharacterized protein n=1 Tax=Moraxella lacunata TaxID=477 RepID=A0A378T5G4_MORLA|nr:DUF5682 family protein [Moraxella lacunata]STZ56052.1 Uncharacterised protein [Moraxella lacunata]
MKNIHYFGIRHHGVGSAKRLLSALDRLQPKKVLIEGASDCTDLLPLLAHADMRPPVALLAYASDMPECHFYYPFAKFSPEYQAVLWAVKHGAEVAFIDLPVAVNLAIEIEKLEQLKAQANADELAETDDGVVGDKADEPNKPSEKSDEPDDEFHNQSNNETSDETLSQLRFDPIGVVGRLAGYHDGESFWNDVIEQSVDDDVAVFGAVHQMMRALRQKVLDEKALDEKTGVPNDEHENWREAFMRQEIRRHSKDLGDGDCVAVVCGAWHVPALDDEVGLVVDGKKQVHTAKSDTALLKNLPKKLAPSKLKTTWIPYTMPRLASFGYGAGVDAPMWYQHLWENSTNVHENWLTHIANALRERGQVISTASVIEATRLAMSLAVVRGRRVVGFEELTESVVACLCFGERLLWEQIASEVLLGKAVGSVPSELPLAPLLEDLERLQKQTKLKPEAIPKEIDVDLRSEIGLKKSHLLHRLAILGVNWGEQRHTGSSRGTFRERWEICWEPEFAVTLVENLVYGNTIFEASANRLMEKISQATELSDLVNHIQTALESGLDKSAMTGIQHLSEQATHTDNVLSLLKSLSPLIHLERYGTARKVSLDKVGELVYELTVKASVGLPYAIKNINDDEASDYHRHVLEVHTALKLTQNDDLGEVWWQSLGEVVSGIQNGSVDNGHFQVVGLACRLLYENDELSDEVLGLILQKTLSPSLGANQSARFFEGFFLGATEQLLYNKPLLNALENWILSLDEEDFTQYLPLFRRVFSGLDSTEKKRLLDVIFGAGGADDVFVYHDEIGGLWETQLANLVGILG